MRQKYLERTFKRGNLLIKFKLFEKYLWFLKAAEKQQNCSYVLKLYIQDVISNGFSGQGRLVKDMLSEKEKSWEVAAVKLI